MRQAGEWRARRLSLKILFCPWALSPSISFHFFPSLCPSLSFFPLSLFLSGSRFRSIFSSTIQKKTTHSSAVGSSAKEERRRRRKRAFDLAAVSIVFLAACHRRKSRSETYRLNTRQEQPGRNNPRAVHSTAQQQAANGRRPGKRSGAGRARLRNRGAAGKRAEARRQAGRPTRQPTRTRITPPPITPISPISPSSPHPGLPTWPIKPAAEPPTTMGTQPTSTAKNGDDGGGDGRERESERGGFWRKRWLPRPWPSERAVAELIPQKRPASAFLSLSRTLFKAASFPTYLRYQVRFCMTAQELLCKERERERDTRGTRVRGIWRRSERGVSKRQAAMRPRAADFTGYPLV